MGPTPHLARGPWITPFPVCYRTHPFALLGPGQGAVGFFGFRNGKSCCGSYPALLFLLHRHIPSAPSIHTVPTLEGDTCGILWGWNPRDKNALCEGFGAGLG